ncbi:MAG: hypothetical protein HY303_10625, partial [Candidatus Wallbacteria bacterium]|nr:hypothetical protein [Candidatus Wallbacteria bacterium]
MSQPHELLKNALESYAGAKTRVRLAADAALMGAAVFAGGALLFAIDYACSLPPQVRASAGAVYAALLGTLLVRLAARWLRRETASTLAVEIELRSERPFRSTFVTAVELGASRDAERFGYSCELVEACAHSAAELATQLDAGALADRFEVRRDARRLAWGALAALAAGFWGHEALGYIAARYAHPFTTQEAAGPVEFRVTPGDIRLAEGSELTVKLKLAGTERFPRMLKGTTQEVVELRHDGEAFGATLSGLTESFDYRFEAGPFRSRAYHVTIVRPPQVKEFALLYHYPAYTGLKDDTQEQGSKDIVAPVGTKVTLSGEATAPLTSATLVFDSHRRVAARLSGATAFTHSFDVERAGTYSIELVGPEGFPNRPAIYHITAVEDRIPLVYLLEPGKDLSLGVNEMTTIPLKVFATDDYGVKDLSLHYSLAQRFEYTYLSSDYTETIAIPQGDGKKLTVSQLWELRKRVFQPGDVVTYYVEAADAMPGPRPHAGRSKSYTIRIPFLTDVAKEASSEQEEQLSTVEDLAHKQKEIDEKLGTALKEIKSQEGQVDWKTRQELETLSKKQQELKKRAEEVSSKMQSTLDKMQKNDLVDAGTLDKLKEVQDLFNQVADGRMKELMEQMRQLMSQSKLEPSDISKVQKDFDKARYARELDRVLASLKKLRVQQEIQRAVKSVEQLAKEQDELRRETEKRLKEGKPADGLAARQKELEEKTSKVMQDL